MGLTYSRELFTARSGHEQPKVVEYPSLPTGFEETSRHEFYSWEEINSVNNSLNLEEDLETQIRRQPS